MVDTVSALLDLRTSVLLGIDDAGRLLIGNDESGSSQLVEVGLDGAWRSLTDLGEPVTGRYLPGERTVVASVDPSGSERTQLWLLDLSGDGPLPEPRPLVTDPAHIHSLLEVAPDTVFYATNRRNEVDFDVVARTVSTGEERVLYDGGGWFDDLAVSPDGRWIAASRMTLLPASSQLLVIDAGTGEVVEISDPDEPGEWHDLHWLPGGDLLAAGDSGGERFTVRRVDPVTRQVREVLADPATDLSAVPAPDGRAWAVIAAADGADTLTVVATGPDGGPVAAGTGDRHTVALPAEGKVAWMTRPQWSPGGELFGFTFTSPVTPPEAYCWSPTTGTVRRTVSNPESALPAMPTPTRHRYPSVDGESVPVFVLRGPQTDGSAVVTIHGGPESESALVWNPIQAALALAGHTVVIPNVRGSAGYGRRWLSLDDVEKRLDSVADLAALHDWLPTVEVDPDRVALWGGSYGGYMVLAGLTFHAGLWAAGVDIVGMSSLTTFMENTSAYRRAYREREYGSLAAHRDVLDAASPLPIIDRLTVPLFVIHGRNDPRVPLSEAEQVAAAVRANGAACELLVYDDEGHGLAKRANRLDAYPRALAFLAEHLR